MKEIIVRENGKAVLAKEFVQKIRDTLELAKAAKKAEESLKAALCQEMEKYGVDRIDNADADLSIIHFPETETTVFDQNAFAAEMPDLYLDYCTKKRKTKSFVKIGSAPKAAKEDARSSQ